VVDLYRAEVAVESYQNFRIPEASTYREEGEDVIQAVRVLVVVGSTGTTAAHPWEEPVDMQEESPKMMVEVVPLVVAAVANFPVYFFLNHLEEEADLMVTTLNPENLKFLRRDWG